MTPNELTLLNTLQDKVNKVLSFVSSQEKILRKDEGSLTLVLPNNRKEYCVKINSYLMESSGFNTSYQGRTLETALQWAITGVDCWDEFEKDIGNPLRFISRDRQDFIQNYL